MKDWFDKAGKAFMLVDSIELAFTGTLIVLGLFALVARAIYLAWN